MKRYRVIVPSWSQLSVEMQAETGCQYPLFVQLGGQPLYRHILSFYEKVKDEVEFILVLPEQAPDLLFNHLAGFDVRVLRLDTSQNIGDTVLAATEGLVSGQSLVVHMADTLISPHDVSEIADILYVQLRTDLYRWTSIRKDRDGAVCVVTDRDRRSAGVEQMVCVGVFMFSDGPLFASQLSTALASPVARVDPFFSAIEGYSKLRAIDLKSPQFWHDCGHIDSYYESRLSYHNLRHFNTLTYDAEHGLVTKQSRNSEAFRHQVRWFKQVPDELGSFLPRIYDSSDGCSPYITMELLSIPTLGDLLINNRLDVGAWNDVARKVHLIHSIMCKYSFDSPLAQQIASEIYVHKTLDRIHQFYDQRPEVRDLWVDASGRRFALDDVLATLQDYVYATGLLAMKELAPIHGDMCFSNLMYDPRGRHIKLIDPRGEFGIPGIYGDPRYDKAKLMHSYAGGYDFIVSDHFDVSVSAEGQLDCHIKRDDYHQKIVQIFNTTVFSDEQDLSQCNAIQALLFLSMLPLHSDKPQRQLAMLHIGLTKYAHNLIIRGGGRGGMTVIVTMAGAGSRFRSQGYEVPKHMIRARGKTLFEWSMESLCSFFDQPFVFACLAEHDLLWIQEKAWAMGIRQTKVAPRTVLSLGQAQTAYEVLHQVAANEEVWIYNIDTYIERGLVPSDMENHQGCLHVFESHSPSMSFVRFDEQERVVEVAEKKVISQWATVGIYGFASAALYRQLYEDAYHSGVVEEVGGERYVAPMYQLLLRQGGPVCAPKLDLSAVHLLGTPLEVQSFDPRISPPSALIKLGLFSVIMMQIWQTYSIKL